METHTRNPADWRSYTYSYMWNLTTLTPRLPEKPVWSPCWVVQYGYSLVQETHTRNPADWRSYTYSYMWNLTMLTPRLPEKQVWSPCWVVQYGYSLVQESGDKTLPPGLEDEAIHKHQTLVTLWITWEDTLQRPNEWKVKNVKKVS